MLLIVVALVVSVAGLLLAPYWLGRAWTRDGFWQLRDDVYDEWMSDGYRSVVLNKFVNRTEVTIDQLHRMSVWTLISTHSTLKKIGREEMQALFPDPRELDHLSPEERELYEQWDKRFDRLVMRHLVFSSWSGIAIGGLGAIALHLTPEHDRAEGFEKRLRNDSQRLVAAAGPGHLAPC